jgi:hypothetical protein
VASGVPLPQPARCRRRLAPLIGDSVRNHYNAGATAAKVAFKLEDSHGSIAPLVGSFNPMAGGVVAAHDAPEGRRQAHALWAGGLSGAGHLAGGALGTAAAGLVIGALVSTGINLSPQNLEIIGTAGKNLGAGLLGNKGVALGQYIARKGDSK